jgi:hypothetical protein
VDWFKLATDTYWNPEKIMVEKGGPRAVEALGDKGVIVLQFANYDLESRHRDFVQNGAQHSFPNYWPHVTFAANADGVDLDKVEPYRGKLQFGPELWEPLDDDGALVLTTPVVEFAADQLDAIDRLTLAMSAQGTEAVAAMVAPIRASLAMLQALESMDTAAFAAALADPLLAVRAAEEAGLGADAVA